MKKRRLLIPLLALLCLLLTLAIASCGEESTPPAGDDPATDQTPHTHTLTHHAAVAADCDTAGSIEYWECTACDKYFSNADATVEITAKPSVITSAHSGTLTHHAAVAADCDSNGNIEYWECTACDRYFSNEACTAEITDKAAVTIPLKHIYGTDNVCTQCDRPLQYTEGLAYTLNDDGVSYSVTGIGTATATDLVIPYYYEEKPVTGIGSDAFYSCSSLTTITIPASVTCIGDEAFQNCSSLTTVSFGANSQLTSIGDKAFYSCSGLTTITIPASVTSIDSDAFSYCSSLTTITIPASVTSIGDNPFAGCSNLTALTVQSGNTAYYMSGNCLIERESKTLITGFDNSVIPTDGSVTSIGSFAFEYCRSLTTITIPASVTSIGDRAFYGCYSLTTVSFGANSQLTSIGSYAFSDCDSLTTVSFGANSQLTSIGTWAFYGCGLTTITIPASVTSIGYGAFNDCSSLTSVTFENPNGWWRASYSTATSGTDIPAADLSDPATAATYLRFTYRDYYWKRG